MSARQRDLRAGVRRIADFMGVDLSAEELDTVTRQSTFEHMRRLGPTFEPPMVVPRSAPGGSVVRRGRSGTSRELLSLAQQRRIDTHFRAELTRLGSDFPYDATYGSEAISRAQSDGGTISS